MEEYTDIASIVVSLLILTVSIALLRKRYSSEIYIVCTHFIYS